MVKQREELAKAFEDGNRLELAAQERGEICIIRDFMPKQLGDEQVRQACQKIIAEVGGGGLRDMGKCMAALKDRYPGQMDFSKASGVVKSLLQRGGAAGPSGPARDRGGARFLRRTCRCWRNSSNT